MEFRNIKTFMAVAEHQSFSKAAHTLGYAQSTVTAQIQQLEQEFEILLFERIHRSIRLTAAGEQFMDHAKRLLRAEEEARSSMKKNPVESGEIRLAMADSLSTAFFPAILERFHRELPGVRVRLVTGDTDTLFEMLRHNEADLVYTLDQRIYSSELITAWEQETKIVFVAAPAHPAAGKLLKPEELVRQKCSLTEKGMSYRKHLDQFLAAASLELIPFLEMGNVEILKSLVEKGTGISFLPEYTVRRSIAAGRLTEVRLDGAEFRVWRQLIYHKNKWVTPQMQAITALIRNLDQTAEELQDST